MKNTTEIVLKMLNTSNKKDVERATGIPADRIYKWLKGKGNPKAADLETLFRYFQTDNQLSSESNINQYENVNKSLNIDKQLIGVSDIGKLNPQLGYDENSTFPIKKSGQDNNEWKTLYFNLQDQVTLLSQQVEILNQIIKK